MGRLFNFAEKGTPECNAHPEYFEIHANGEHFKTVIFVADREIQMLEEIRFDYGDSSCIEMFSA